MTDNLDRVFVEVRFDEKTASVAKVLAELEARLAGLDWDFSISPNKPPRIFTDDEIENRFTGLFLAAQKFKDAFLKDFGVEVEIDPRLLYIATISAYDDIERYKAYHLEKPYRDRSDAVKRAAYLTKWLSKIMPLQTRLTIGDLSDGIDPSALDAKPALANIMFAIWVSMVHISVDCKKDTWLSERAEFHLAYDLLYRRVNEDALVATYQKIMDLATGEPIIR